MGGIDVIDLHQKFLPDKGRCVADLDDESFDAADAVAGLLLVHCGNDQAYDLPREHWCKAALRRYLLVHGLDGIGLRQLITAALDDDLFTQFLPQFLQALAVFADKRCCC